MKVPAFSDFMKPPFQRKEQNQVKGNSSPVIGKSLLIKQENQAINQAIDANFSAFSKASYESHIEEINFDHCQYIEIMQNMHKDPIKLIANENGVNNAKEKLKSFRLMEKNFEKLTEKREISDFATISNKMNLLKPNHSLKKAYICKYCQASFSKPCALGGHMSKLHKGRSKFFKKRKEKREMRETERQRNTFFKTIFKTNC